jgi:LDH2 family malate/lactate/ureidoglycolate dehydrogenase
MPHFSADQLGRMAKALLAAAGTPDDIADVVAGSLVESNLKGVDSHGVMQLPWYLEEVEKGAIEPAARPEIEHKAPSAALVRGNKGFGIYALSRATELAVETAQDQGAACVGLTECSHTGRIGYFAEAAARQGLFAMIMGGGAHRIWSNVVPFGGTKPIMSTNPYALAMPGGRFGPVVVDFATSTVADGKIAVHRAEGRAVPEDWILDKHGQPTTDPEAFFDGGMHRPAAGHKGYGLGLIAEQIGDAALAAPPEFNWFVVAVNLGAFRPLAAYAETAETYLQFVKDVPPAAGFDEVLLPGEPEQRAAKRRCTEGIPVPDPVWEQLMATGRSVGVDLDAIVRKAGSDGEAGGGRPAKGC